jgi:hypothetical protein
MKVGGACLGAALAPFAAWGQVLDGDALQRWIKQNAVKINAGPHEDGTSANEMSKAKRHIEEALKLLDDALTQRPGPKPSARAIRGYLAEARVAATKADSRGAVSALDEAILVLEQRPVTG